MVDTVDNFQGDERDIIILSLVATNRLENSFMKVYNRINVAISRARCLLVIVGNGRAFSNLRTEIDGKNDFVYRRIVDQAKFHRGYITERDVMGE
jgi:superfamily I DNA and/or RNA helicase